MPNGQLLPRRGVNPTGLRCAREDLFAYNNRWTQLDSRMPRSRIDETPRSEASSEPDMNLGGRIVRERVTSVHLYPGKARTIAVFAEAPRTARTASRTEQPHPQRTPSGGSRLLRKPVHTQCNKIYVSTALSTCPPLLHARIYACMPQAVGMHFANSNMQVGDKPAVPWHIKGGAKLGPDNSSECAT